MIVGHIFQATTESQNAGELTMVVEVDLLACTLVVGGVVSSFMAAGTTTSTAAAGGSAVVRDDDVVVSSSVVVGKATGLMLEDMMKFCDVEKKGTK